jgi:hypothetical protein
MVEPLSREFLLSRGSCCGSGCTNCPWRIKLPRFYSNPEKLKEYDDMIRQANLEIANALAVDLTGDVVLPEGCVIITEEWDDEPV